MGYLNFPHAAQVFVIQRDIIEIATQKSRSETVYGATSPKPHKADPKRLLSLSRAHGSIENQLHCVRDVTFDQDRCRVRKSVGAQVMATLRNLAISLLRMTGATNIAQALRQCARMRFKVLRFIGLRL